jgi:FkbM family methyltransferase
MKLTPAKILLDRPGTRGLLGHLVTARSRMLGNNARIFYDGAWIHRFGNDIVADWTPKPTRNLPQWLETQRDYWLSLYVPHPGAAVIDVGAGIGVEALMFSRVVGPSGRVVAIEAHPRTFECLLKTCEYNALDNVTPLNIALVDREQTVSFEDEAHHIGNAVAPGKSGSISVRGRSLDDVCEELGIGDVSYIRTNIEGAERLAITGMQKTIRRTAFVGIACHDFKADKTRNEFFRTKKIVKEFLTDNGFRIIERDAQKPWTRDYVYAHNPAVLPDPLALRTRR